MGAEFNGERNRCGKALVGNVRSANIMENNFHKIIVSIAPKERNAHFTSGDSGETEFHEEVEGIFMEQMISESPGELLAEESASAAPWEEMAEEEPTVAGEWRVGDKEEEEEESLVAEELAGNRDDDLLREAGENLVEEEERRKEEGGAPY